MSGKSTKLIIGIILLLLAIYMYAFGGFKFVISLILGIIGLALIILSFTGEQEMNISEIKEEEEVPSTKQSPTPSTPEDLSDVTPDFPESEPKSDVPNMGEEEKKE